MAKRKDIDDDRMKEPESAETSSEESSGEDVRSTCSSVQPHLIQWAGHKYARRRI